MAPTVVLTVAPPIPALVMLLRTLPATAPVGPIGEALTAASASSRPSPKTLLSSAVPPQARSEVSTAVSSRICRVCGISPTSAGAADHIRATAPDRCGAAIEVPLKEL